ncbi:MAG: peptide chain release factor N(5)-glutamine methyltransferase [bacterium]|nr:peptide chain release factor N(5)-glutamine methyltransferase [bacterium]
MTRDERWLLEEKYAGRADAPGFATDCARLAEGEPVAYVIGSQPFLGLRIYLDSHPLIPRPETEWWVEQLLQNVRHRKSYITFLDLCAGSGAIGCAILKYLPQAEVWFGEIDSAHEPTIRKNIEMNGPIRPALRSAELSISASRLNCLRTFSLNARSLNETRAHIGIGDLFAPFPDTKFDLIVCNPPYVPNNRELSASVARHEPALALRAGKDGLALIRRIAVELPNRLARGGEAWVECDSEHAPEARALFERADFSTRIMQDQYGLPRVLVVHPMRMARGLPSHGV